MKKLILIAFTAFILVSGCKPLQNTIYVDRWHDSITSVIVKDTFVKYLPQSQSVITPKKSFLSTDLAFSYASIDSIGLLHHSIENKGTIPAKITTKTTKVTYNTTTIKTITKTITEFKTVYKTHWFGIVDWIIIGLVFLGGIFWLLRKFKVIKF